MASLSVRLQGCHILLANLSSSVGNGVTVSRSCPTRCPPQNVNGEVCNRPALPRAHMQDLLCARCCSRGRRYTQTQKKPCLRRPMQETNRAMSHAKVEWTAGDCSGCVGVHGAQCQSCQFWNHKATPLPITHSCLALPHLVDCGHPLSRAGRN